MKHHSSRTSFFAQKLSDHIRFSRNALLIILIMIVASAGLFWYMSRYSEKNRAADAGLDMTLQATQATYTVGDPVIVHIQATSQDGSYPTAFELTIPFDSTYLCYTGDDQGPCLSPSGSGFSQLADYFTDILYESVEDAGSGMKQLHLTILSKTGGQTTVSFDLHFVAQQVGTTTITIDPVSTATGGTSSFTTVDYVLPSALSAQVTIQGQGGPGTCACGLTGSVVDVTDNSCTPGYEPACRALAPVSGGTTCTCETAITLTPSPGQTYCVDTDGGNDEFTPGFIKGTGDGCPPAMFADECVPSLSGGQSNAVLEYRCGGLNQCFFSDPVITCDYGCQNGACVQGVTPTETSTPTPTVTPIAMQSATLAFASVNSQVNINEPFSVDVAIDAGSHQIAGADIFLTYNQNILELQSVTGGTYFPLVNNIPSAGNLYLSGVVANLGDYKTGSGIVAHLIFVAHSTGTTDLSFICDPTLNATSSIINNDTSGSNVLDCNSLQPYTINVSASPITGQITGSPNVTLNLKLRFQGITKQPANGVTTMNVRTILSATDSSFRDEQSVSFTADGSGIWSGTMDVAAVPLSKTYRVFIKGPKHLMRQLCENTPRETVPGLYKCQSGAITLKAGANALDLSNVVLLAGDLPAQNGVVDSLDITFVRQNLGSKEAVNTGKGDLNLDGIIDTQDYTLMLVALGFKYDEK